MTMLVMSILSPSQRRQAPKKPRGSVSRLHRFLAGEGRKAKCVPSGIVLGLGRVVRGAGASRSAGCESDRWISCSS